MTDHAATRFILVGHCGPDGSMLKSAVQRAVPEAEVVYANSAEQLDADRGPDRVWLVNRVLDGSFDTTEGVKLIQHEGHREGAPVMLLISNYADAQQAAVAAGARDGFGKSGLYDGETTDRLRAAASSAANAAENR